MTAENGLSLRHGYEQDTTNMTESKNRITVLASEKRFSWITDSARVKGLNGAVDNVVLSMNKMVEEMPHLATLSNEDIVTIYFAKRFANDETVMDDCLGQITDYGLREAITLFGKGVLKPNINDLYRVMVTWAWERRDNPTERSRTKKIGDLTSTQEILYNYQSNPAG